jgi:GT2 family glycosyltransferase
LWRARGLRVRSRNRIAALIGRSPQAYPLWIERTARTSQPAAEETSFRCAIWPIIDCRFDVTGLDATVQSLKSAGFAINPLVIGSGRGDIQSPRELADAIPELQPWLLPIFPGDETAPGSLAAYARAVAENPQTHVIYADDDLVDDTGRRHRPHFKPDWNPELFEHHDFMSAAAIVRANRQLLQNLPEENWQMRLLRSAIARGRAPLHVREILHHRRSRPSPVVPAKPARFSISNAPSVTAIIPTRDRRELLHTCMEGLGRTDYPDLEVIIVDNGSREPDTIEYLAALERNGLALLKIPGPFNYSALNNAAVAHAHGEILCFLNNDVEFADPDWLKLLVQHAVKPDIGGVGARLLYPDGTIQHAGVFTGIGGGAGHAHRFQRADDPGYFERARLPQRVSAVTGACMVVAKDKFLAVGGFDEAHFPVAFNDVDLCLKLNNRGWQSFYEPRSTLIHHESKSRGNDRSKRNRARFSAELAALKRVWSTDKFQDPYHHPNLSPFCEQFLIAV